MRRGVACLTVSLLALACQAPRAEQHSKDAAPAVADPQSIALDALRKAELARLSRLDMTALPRADTSLGPDPYAIAAWPHGSAPRFVGLLRGESALVLLDEKLGELARTSTPPSPTALTVAENGEIWVASELEPVLARYVVSASGLGRTGGIDLGDVVSVRSLVAAPRGLLHLVEERNGRLLSIDTKRGTTRLLQTECSSAFDISRFGEWLGVSCLHDHAFRLFAVDARGLPRAPARASVVHDGPIWAADAVTDEGGLLLALAGVEDHPLDRTIGSFGYIDSYVFLYRMTPGAAPVRLAAVNVSELGVVTPKVVSLRRDAGVVTVESAGYGSGVFVALRWTEPRFDAPEVETRILRPGIAAWAPHGRGYVAANPLFDAWMTSNEAEAPIDVRSERRPSTALRIGEAAFFTTLMGPFNSATGPKSRFSCETCHFEGHTDGRVHHSGRGEVRVTTKSLLGLVNNRPYFSRAVDHDLTEVVDNEFEVASRGSGHDAWFSVGPRTLPWLGALTKGGAVLDPRTLRESLLEFLIAFNHRPNPSAWGKRQFNELERRGAAAFADSCERCHAARLLTTDPTSRVPFEAWESLVLSPAGPIVWARSEYEKTDVEPYVHANGARVPSLRRLYTKRPYFTNGSAATLRDVARAVRLRDGRFSHDARRAAPDLRALPEQTQAAIVAFLELL